MSQQNGLEPVLPNMKVWPKTEMDIAAHPVNPMTINPEAKSETKSLAKHPGGRLPKALSTSATVKEKLLKAFLLSGGLERLVSLLKEVKPGKSPTAAKLQKVFLADERFLNFVKLLTKLLPQQTEHEEVKTVTFIFTDGTEKSFNGMGDPSVVEAEEVKE